MLMIAVVMVVRVVVMMLVFVPWESLSLSFYPAKYKGLEVLFCVHDLSKRHYEP